MEFLYIAFLTILGIGILIEYPPAYIVSGLWVAIGCYGLLIRHPLVLKFHKKVLPDEDISKITEKTLKGAILLGITIFAIGVYMYFIN